MKFNKKELVKFQNNLIAIYYWSMSLNFSAS